MCLLKADIDFRFPVLLHKCHLQESFPSTGSQTMIDRLQSGWPLIITQSWRWFQPVKRPCINRSFIFRRPLFHNGFITTISTKRANVSHFSAGTFHKPSDVSFHLPGFCQKLISCARECSTGLVHFPGLYNHECKMNAQQSMNRANTNKVKACCNSQNIFHAADLKPGLESHTG